MDAAVDRPCTFTGNVDCSSAVDSSPINRFHQNTSTCVTTEKQLVPLAQIDLLDVVAVRAFTLSVAVMGE